MIKSVSTLGFVVISLTSYSQNWLNEVQTQSRGNQSNIQRSVNINRGNSNPNRGSRGNNTNTINIQTNTTNGNLYNNGGGLLNNSSVARQTRNTDVLINRNVMNNRSQSVTTPQRERNDIAQNVVQQRSNPVEQRAVIHTQQAQNPVVVNRANTTPVSRGAINPAPQNINVQVNTGNENNADVFVFNENVSRQFINDDNNFSTNKIINREPKFEANQVQRKEIMEMPKPSADLGLSWRVKTENVNVGEKTRTEKITIPKMEKSGASHVKRKSGKHAYYSQNNKGYMGMKIKNWYKRNFKFKRKIRVSVSCPSF